MQILEKKRRKSLPKAMNPSNTTAKHNRSKSDLEDKSAKDVMSSSLKACNQPKLPDRNSNPHLKSETKKGIHPSKSEAQNTLRKEILHLERHLKDQQVVRGALEKTLGPDHTAPVTISHESPMLKASFQLSNLRNSFQLP